MFKYSVEEAILFFTIIYLYLSLAYLEARYKDIISSVLIILLLIFVLWK